MVKMLFEEVYHLIYGQKSGFNAPHICPCKTKFPTIYPASPKKILNADCKQNQTVLFFKQIIFAAVKISCTWKFFFTIEK